MADRPATTAAILEEFDHDPEALAAEILALRRVVAELRSLHRDDERPFIVVSPPDRPEPPDPWPPFAPRAVVES
jgi:hypothetical protein